MQNKNKPLLLRPSGKDYLWGGSRLNDEFEKNIDLTPLAETWECSTHPDGPSYVAVSYTHLDVYKRQMQWCVDNDFCGEAAKAVRYDSDFVWEGESWPEGAYIISEKDRNAVRLENFCGR